MKRVASKGWNLFGQAIFIEMGLGVSMVGRDGLISQWWLFWWFVVLHSCVVHNGKRPLTSGKLTNGGKFSEIPMNFRKAPKN